MRSWNKTRIPGIRYREHKTRKHGIQPDKYFSLTYWSGGKTHSEGLGWSSEGWTLDKANQAMAEIRMNQKTGTGPETLNEKKRMALEAKQAAEVEKARIEAERLAAEQAEKDRLRLEQETRFDAVFKKYCESNNHKKSLHDEQTLVRLWVEPAIGKKRMSEITTFDIERIKHNMTKAGRSLRSVQYTFAVIRQVFNYAKSRELFAGESPTKAVKLPKFDNKRVRFLSPVEADALLVELKRRSVTVYRMAVLSLYTGARLGEITKLLWQHVDTEKRQITFVDTKNTESRVAFMADAVFNLFSEMPKEKPNDLIFPSNTKTEIQFLSKTFQRAVDQLGMNAGITDRRMKVVFHTFRHSCASHLAMSGADLSTIQAVLGHKTLTMTERYSHLTNKHIRDAIDRLQNTLEVKQAEVIPIKRAG